MVIFGFAILLYPVALVNPILALIGSLLVFFISLLKHFSFTVVDLIIVFILCHFAFAWQLSSVEEKRFIISQTSSYFVFIFTMRFLYFCRGSLISIIVNTPLWIYLVMSILYLTIQYKVGYVYEIGALEAFLLVRLVISDMNRKSLLILLFVHFIVMYFISTRSTPLVAALIVALIYFVHVPKAFWKTLFFLMIIITPVLGVLMSSFSYFEFLLSEVDNNAGIRLEMLKGATALVGFKEFALGTGFGQPFRDINYDYNFWHPLLNWTFEAYQVSNHNSLFDIFLRFGFFGYVFFIIYFLKSLKLVKRSLSKYFYILLYVSMYSLTVNAYLDSTRLSHIFAIFCLGIWLAMKGKNVSKAMIHKGYSAKVTLDNSF